MQLQQRTSTVTDKKPPFSCCVKHLFLSPKGDGLAAEANLASVRAHDKVAAQNDGAAAIGGVACAVCTPVFDLIPVGGRRKRGGSSGPKRRNGSGDSCGCGCYFFLR